MQEISGICNICHKTAPLHTCPLCGRQVCDSCLTSRGPCVQCTRGRMLN